MAITDFAGEDRVWFTLGLGGGLSNEIQDWLGIYSRSNRLRDGRLGPSSHRAHADGAGVGRSSVPLPELAASLLIGWLLPPAADQTTARAPRSPRCVWGKYRLAGPANSGPVRLLGGGKAARRGNPWRHCAYALRPWGRGGHAPLVRKGPISDARSLSRLHSQDRYAILDFAQNSDYATLG